MMLPLARAMRLHSGSGGFLLRGRGLPTMRAGEDHESDQKHQTDGEEDRGTSRSGRVGGFGAGRSGLDPLSAGNFFFLFQTLAEPFFVPAAATIGLQGLSNDTVLIAFLHGILLDHLGGAQMGKAAPSRRPGPGADRGRVASGRAKGGGKRPEP